MNEMELRTHIIGMVLGSQMHGNVRDVIRTASEIEAYILGKKEETNDGK